MTWIEHPRLKAQAETRKLVLAKFQYEHGFSPQELAEHFAKLAEAKANGFNTIEEFNASKERESSTETLAMDFNHWNMVAKQLQTKMVKR